MAAVISVEKNTMFKRRANIYAGVIWVLFVSLLAAASRFRLK